MQRSNVSLLKWVIGWFWDRTRARPRRSASILLALLGAGLPAGCIVAGAISNNDFLDTIEVENVDIANAPDGTYSGEFTIVPPPGTYVMNRHFKVDVGISAGRYASVHVVEPKRLNDDERFRALGQQIVDRNSLLSVDAISGASFSRRSMLKAVQDAAARAAKEAP